MSFSADDQRLAIDGGPPAVAGDPAPWPLALEAVRQALEQAWADGSWAHYHASHTERLGKQLAQIHGTPHVTLCCSGTVAVELALRGLKIGPGDEVILAGYDFPGNFRAIEATGAFPVLVDLCPDSWLIDLEQIPRAVGPKTRAVIASHLHGGLIDMPRLREMAAALDLKIVEDACQVPGAKIAGRNAGGWGDVCTLSFGGSKLLTAGRGGAVLTGDVEIHQRMKVFAQRGNDAFPLSQLQAAVLLPQLAELDALNARRRTAVARLLAKTAGLPGLQPTAAKPEEHPGEMPAYYKLPWLYLAEQLGGLSIEQFVAALQAEGIPIDRGFRGFAERSERRCRKSGELPHSRGAAQATLLLHHPVLLAPEERLEAVARGIQKVTRAAERLISRQNTSMD